MPAAAPVQGLGGRKVADDPDTQAFDKRLVHDELDRVQADVHRLLTTAAAADLARPTIGTRWTNEQLLFHMLVEYMIVGSPLIGVVRVLGRAPRGVSRALAWLQNATTRPANVTNYRGISAATRARDSIADIYRYPTQDSNSTAASSPLAQQSHGNRARPCRGDLTLASRWCHHRCEQ